MEKVVGVRFRNVGKIYYFNPKNYKVKVGDHVIVETARGVEYGREYVEPRSVKEDEVVLDSFRPVTADVDEVKFTLAISNLVENGIKYNVDEGWVRVTLDADHKDFYVTVADSGLGIPEDSIERIFERFYRVDKSHSREIGGTGLGLAITRSSIAMPHGIIKVSSKEGEGTTFTVKIPLSYIPS